MKLGSLFDGIGGFPLAAAMNGITPVWASEIEKFPIEVTKTRFPDMKHLGDITQINGAEIEPVDIISAGSPCQDLSVAGKREGLSGARSGLFMEFIRIVGEMRNATSNQYPRFIIWENVPGAFSSNKGQDFRAVLEKITEAEIPMPHTGRWATAGMVRGGKCEVAWRVLDAQYWGVPQRRRRIFLVADFAGQRAGEILFECEGVSRDIAESGKARQEVAAGAGNGAQGASWLVRMREGCAGGGKGPLISEDKSLTLGCSNDQTLIAGTVSAKWAKGTGGPAGDECQNLVAFACNQRDGVRDMKDESGALQAQLVEQGYTVRRLTPLECERLQGFPDGWTDIEGASDTGRYKALGNSVAVPCVTWIIGRIKKMGR